MAEKYKKWIENLSAEERINLASKRIICLTERMVDLIYLHESNRIIFYSKTLSGQITGSYALEAFEVFSQTMLKSEISQFCSIWDKQGKDRISLPTVSALLNDLEVQNSLTFTEDARSAHVEKEKEHKIERLTQTIKDIEKFPHSDALKAVRDFRNLYTAHFLEESARIHEKLEARTGVEDKLLEMTVPIIEAFQLGIRDNNYNFGIRIKQAKKSAEALWRNCIFHVTK